ncbi:hypothetical protein [Aquibacillus salsiterrae]|uniref:Uncharacterized protein n=1 Tax=Aquibacillus salsiterrae TaxID=2950439 RepID=A0A9X3WDX8_9BACI|nr:hypothetical protein [Aquibacillus salsiterrae]MDC3416691.1 hypothetical protein [Aquibacillus salsiterrae]
MDLFHQGTIAETEELELIISPECRITVTECYNNELIVEKMEAIITKLESKTQGNINDFAELSPLLKLLPRKYEPRLELEIRMNSLKKKWNIENFEKKETVKDKKAIDSYENILIENNHTDFINLGKEGRKWVLDRISKANDDIDLNILFKKVDSLIKDIKEKVVIVQTHVDINVILSTLNSLFGESFGILNSSIKKETVNKIIEMENKQFETLNDLKGTLARIYTTILKERNMASTINKEEFRSFSEKVEQF